MEARHGSSISHWKLSLGKADIHIRAAHLRRTLGWFGPVRGGALRGPRMSILAQVQCLLPQSQPSPLACSPLSPVTDAGNIAQISRSSSPLGKPRQASLKHLSQRSSTRQLLLLLQTESETQHRGRNFGFD